MLVKCIITTEGAAVNCQVIKSLPWMDRPVLAALAQQRFTPAIYKGRPVNVEYILPFKFRLQAPPSPPPRLRHEGEPVRSAHACSIRASAKVSPRHDHHAEAMRPRSSGARPDRANGQTRV